MRVLIVATILILALSLGHCFRVNDVFDTFEDFVETDRQSDNPEDRQFDDLNDNIPAVFAATLGASLLANVLFGGGGAPALNKIDCKCGVEKTARVIGGQDVDIANKYPWMASIISTGTGTIRDRHFCGGSIVASKFVLTAAHCLFSDTAQTMPEEAANVQVRIGDHDISMEDETTTLTQKTINVAKIIMHENYQPNANADGTLNYPFLVNDIALLELEEEVDLTVYTPVCLARAGITESGTGSVYGWGNTGVGNNPGTNTCSPATADPNILQETQLMMCTAAESAAQGGGQGLVDGQLCAVGTASSPYRGDSGGPLTIKSGDQHVQVGDVSFGEGCPTVPITGDAVGVFGRISYYRAWLEGKMPGATTCSNGFDSATMLTRYMGVSSSWRLQQTEAERRRKEEVDKKKRKEEKKRRKAEKKKHKLEKKKRKQEAAAAAAAAAAEATTEPAAEETTMQ